MTTIYFCRTKKLCLLFEDKAFYFGSTLKRYNTAETTEIIYTLLVIHVIR